MNYLALLRTLEGAPDFSERAMPPTDKTDKTTLNPSFGSSGSSLLGTFQKIEAPEPGNTGDTPRGCTPKDLQAAAGEDWPLIADNPEAIDAFSKAQSIRAMRERGEVPPHYTQRAECSHCGPVWLWEGAPARAQGCPWCLNRAIGRPIPRPPVRCADCRHWRPDEINPPGGLGSCDIRADVLPWPWWESRCGDWRAKTEDTVHETH